MNIIKIHQTLLESVDLFMNVYPVTSFEQALSNWEADIFPYL